MEGARMFLVLLLCLTNSQWLEARTFDEVFAWGVASSAYQIEGNWDKDGKGPSIWDNFTQKQEDGDNGNDACDSYFSRIHEDCRYLEDLKVTHYKISVSWSRIFPDGTQTSVNDRGIKFYEDLVRALDSIGVKPVVTLYHYDLPLELQKYGGWLNSSTVDHFEEYARTMYSALGEWVKTWVTIHDPWSVAYRGYGDGSHAPGLKEDAGGAPYKVGHNLVLAHVAAYNVYQREFKQKQGGTGRIGLFLSSDWLEPLTSSSDDQDAAERVFDYTLGWFAGPIFNTGDYPEVMKTNTRVPDFTAQQIANNKGSSDFLGIIPVSSHSVRGDNSQTNETGYMADQGAITTAIDRSVHFLVTNLLRKITNKYNIIPVYVLDAGVGDCGTLTDDFRIQHIKDYVNALRTAINEDGIRLAGYFAGNYMDSFEWSTGYQVRYGLHYVEFSNKERTPRASAQYFRNLIMHHGDDFSYPSHFISDIIRQKDDFLIDNFPAHFRWGVATAAFQIEGGWDADGKGPSMWDVFAHNNRLAEGATGDVACDSYHKYKEDVQMVKRLGVSHYRFSIAWSRVMPDGTPRSLNQAGIQYYNNLINELLANGIQPMVTLYHWDLPQALQEKGGFENDKIVDYYNDYAQICFEQFGDRVPMWITFNEAFVTAWLGYGIGAFAPGIYSPGEAAYTAAHNIIRSHVKAYHTYNDHFRHRFHGQVGITLDCDWKEPMTSSARDRYAAERALNFKLGWFANPIYGNGDYPAVMRQFVDQKSREEGRNVSRLPVFTEEEKSMNKGSFDFLGLNHYTTQYVRANDNNYHNSYEKDQKLDTKLDECWPRTRSDWLRVNPWGLRSLLRWVKRKYHNPPVYITENGVSDDGGTLEDDVRIDYYRGYTNEMLKAIRHDGCDVRGYVAWSLMDNLEWTSGYTQKFGLYSVNFTDPQRTRTEKKSVKFYSSLVRNNGFIGL